MKTRTGMVAIVAPTPMEVDAYRGLEPIQLWRHFAALNAIPRPSGREEQARQYVLEVAQRAGLDANVDAAGNAVVRVPATAGAGGPVVAVQGHLDMVCDAAPGAGHDWDRDPVVPRRDGDRIFASGTTLGADNGIGVAAALALIAAPDVRHGGLELLFTVGEESGRWSAFELDASALSAEMLVNLDSENAEALTIGSAGGSDVDAFLPLRREEPPAGSEGAELRLGGLGGGHSGMQIHEPRANAIKLLAAALDRLRALDPSLRLIAIEGGSAHNAIPRAARASIAVAGGGLPGARAAVARLHEELRATWDATEPGLALELREGPAPSSVLDEGATGTLLSLLRDLPHGVLAWDAELKDTVETSANLAAIHTEEAGTRVFTSVRSLYAAALAETEERVCDLAASAGASAEVKDAYPSWEPRRDSPLREAAVRAYRRTYGREPRLDVLHGGLECGAIVARKPDLDAISFGPSIREAHTPMEHVYAPTVTTTWELLVALLEDLST